MNKRSVIYLFLVILIALTGCETNYLPKPKGYNRLDLPDHSYQNLPDTLPYTFEFSKHAKLLSDTSWISEKDWVEIYYPNLRANIHITYKRVNNDTALLKEYFSDSYTLTSKHQIKAYAIDDIIMTSPFGKTFSIAELDGQVPSQFQFVCTDSVRHFLRGALYFDTKINNDSLRPAIDYMKIDVLQMMNTLQWNEDYKFQ
ncbi:MAG: gliding motility lipoprotein GldD [Cyclobacteriaceae bacterium]|nr:gliding motility lipoprotein GldD [Cyclobacteriaceae bacterium]